MSPACLSPLNFSLSSSFWLCFVSQCTVGVDKTALIVYNARSSMENSGVVEAKVWVCCAVCGGQHRVVPGVGTPMYWCGSKLMSLKEGDNVEYEEAPEESCE